MDAYLRGVNGSSRAGGGPISARRAKRWVTHAEHQAIPAPFRVSWNPTQPHNELGDATAVGMNTQERDDLVILDGSHGEGGGQILRTALSLSLLSGRPFRMVKIRANRDKPGLRPQHQKAVEAAAMLGRARVTGGEVGIT